MKVSNSLKSAIDVSIKFARSLGCSQVDTEHLLYGILSATNSAGIKILNSLGISAETFKRVVSSSKNVAAGNILDMKYSKSVISIFANAEKFCNKNGIKEVEIDEVLYFIILNKNAEATKILISVFKINLGLLQGKLETVIGFKADAKEKPASTKEVTHSALNVEIPQAIEGLGINLTEKVSKNPDMEIIGRDEETERVIEILCRRTKNNPVLVGEAGVGKTSVVEGLAKRIALGEVPELIKNKVIFSMDMASIMAGTKLRGSMEQKLKDAINAIIENGNIIVFIDEIHMLAEAGSKDGDISPSDILKPYLARGEIRLIGATTLDEYSKFIEPDPALERRFQPVRVEEPTNDDTVKILKGIRPSFENYHNVKISDEAIEAAVNMSVRYMTNRFLPDKAIDLIDEACSKKKVASSTIPEEVKTLSKKIIEIDRQKTAAISVQSYALAEELKQQKIQIQNRIETLRQEQLKKTGNSFGEVDAQDIKQVVSSLTGIPVSKISGSEQEKLMNLENLLSEKVIGQPEAVSVVSKAIRRARADINDPKRPIGSFLFLGSTGVGKTELTKALADVLFGSESAVIKLDMSEFMESHSVSRLIGAPPGYVGHEDGGELTEAVKRNPYSIVVFDEIEKAHADIYNLFLQILDEGRLTDSKGKHINFKNTIIIMTSNLGVQDLMKRRKYESLHPEEKKVKSEEFLMDKLKEKFKPEILNRIDSVVIFESLKKENILKIANIFLKSVEKRLKNNKNINLSVSENAKQLICKNGYDELNGARNLKKYIENSIVNPIAELIISKQLSENSAVMVDEQNGKFIFKVLC